MNPDALIAIPPTEAKSLNDYREYYAELGRLTRRPVFIQTRGGAPEVLVSAEFALETARKFPNLGYVKDEHELGFEHFERKRKLARHSPDPIKSVLTAGRARAWTYEMRLGAHDIMTGGPMYAEVYALIRRLHQAGERDRLREVFGKLLMMTILEQHIPGVKPCMMKRRGIFKTSVSRVWDNVLTPAQVDEIEYKFKGLEPYLTPEDMADLCGQGRTVIRRASYSVFMSRRKCSLSFSQIRRVSPSDFPGSTNRYESTTQESGPVAAI